MKRFTPIILILTLLFANQIFAQNVTRVNDLGAAQKTNSPNFVCQAKVVKYSALKDSRTPLKGVNIEVFNLTKQKLELELKNHPLDKFSFNFRQGNEYTILLRKEGYFMKRINAKIGVNGCKACFDGLNTLTPLENNEMNSIMNLQLMMRQVNEGDRVMMPDITFEGKSAQITEKTGLALNELAMLLKDNSNILGQLEIHTDARGDADDNMKLSEDRAKAISDYLSLSGIPKDEINIKAYGERRIINKCYSDDACNETGHAQNKRTIFWLRAQIGENSKFTESLVSILANEGNANFSTQARAPEPIEDIEQKEVKEVIKEKVAVVVKPLIPSEAKAKESAAIAKVDKALPKANLVEGNFGSSFSGKVAISPNDVKEICDVNGVVKPSSRMEDRDNNKLATGVQNARNAKSKVTSTGPVSTRIDVSYNDDGSKTIRRSGKATLISAIYTGYMIEMFTSVDELPNDHKVFKDYGKVYLDDTGIAFSYMLGEFETEEAAQKFIKSVIHYTYPDAKVIKYKEGDRKN
jgi:outer membrane protein OmpA-like peptidoglycan-associated protein